MDTFDAWLEAQKRSLRDWRREILAQETQDATLLAGLESHLDWLSQMTLRESSHFETIRSSGDLRPVSGHSMPICLRAFIADSGQKGPIGERRFSDATCAQWSRAGISTLLTTDSGARDQKA